jgi:hypothetical protein
MMSATAQRAAAPGKAPAGEEGSSSKQAASAATAKGAAPGKTPPTAADSASQGLIRSFFMKKSSAVEEGALSNHETAKPGRSYDSHDNSDNEGSDDDGDDSEDGAGTPLSSRGKDDDDNEHARGHHDGMPKAIRGYTAPSHDNMGKLARHGVFQPPVPMMVQLMSLRAWRLGILYAMGPEGMAKAGTGLARLDKGMADERGLRIVRSFVRNQEGQFVDSDLEEHAPLLFAVLKILMEEHDFQNVALQKMLTQKMHCDPHARFAKPEDDEKECHVLLTVNGDHSFGMSTSSKIQTLKQ